MKPLKTKRLLLRKFTTEDIPAVQNYISCAENNIYMQLGTRGGDGEGARLYIDLVIEESEKTFVFHHHYAAVLKETGVFIGGCRISRDGSLCLFLHRDYWNQGYGTEMGKALLQYGFEELGLHRIFAVCDVENIASYRVMEKIGMRREGHFLESRQLNRLSDEKAELPPFPLHSSLEAIPFDRCGGFQVDKKYADEYLYAILKDEWEAGKEILYYNSLPVVFDGFIELPELSDGVIYLVCTAKRPPVFEKNYCPSYDFAVCKGSEKIGEINLRIGYAGFGPDLSSLYYGGQIGYGIDEKHRGNGYAVRACCLLRTIAKAHGMSKLLITNNPTNTASRRVCEKLGARLVRVARLPEWHDLYKDGQRFMNIFEWSMDV